jgi:diguanylate cyclase (GGDEF)-like protein
VTQTKKFSKRYSLGSLVSIGFIIIIVLTIVSTVVAYERLINFNNILSDVTEKSLPEAAKAGQLNNVLKEVLYLTERLTNSTNLASRRIAIDKLKIQNELLLDTLEQLEGTVHLHNQINTARREIEQLDKLVITRLNNAYKIQQLNQVIYETHDHIVAQLNQQKTSADIEKSLMLLIQIANLTYKAQNIDRLQTVRQTAKAVDMKFEQVLQSSVKLQSQISETTISDIKKLRSLLLNEDAWFSLTLEQLQIVGRVRGRGNFLHNLILDITIISEAKYYEMNKSIIQNAKSAATDISQQVSWVISLSIVLLLLMTATIYFIKNKIVARLLLLNDSVLKRIQSEDVPIDVSGKDEISHLAQSFVYFSEKVEEQKQQLQVLSLTDVLTNLPNRRAMDERLEYEVHSAKRNQSYLSIIILDIDEFKPYNDFYGHIAGDECLKTVAERLKNIQQRDSDFIARYGGEEFVMLLPTTEKQGAIKITERIKEMFETLNIPHNKSKVTDHITVSMGIATFAHNEISNAHKMLNIADEALYRAKAMGRNSFIHTDDL